MNETEKILRDALTMRRTYRAVFGTPQGKIVLRDMAKAASITTSAFTMGSERKTAYDNGARDLVLGILTKIHRTDEDLQRQIEELLIQENQQPQPEIV